jgi:hypothetical protein
MVISWWRVNSKVVVGSDRKCSSNGLPKKICGCHCGFTSYLCLVVVVRICHIIKLIAGELRGHSGLHQVFHELAHELETFNTPGIDVKVAAAKYSPFAMSFKCRLVLFLRGLPEVAVLVLPNVGDVYASYSGIMPLFLPYST